MAANIVTKRGVRVLVSGAGMAGPTLAWFLARFGARVTVVERSPQLLSQGQNIDLRGTALNIVHRMGLDAAPPRRKAPHSPNLPRHRRSASVSTRSFEATCPTSFTKLRCSVDFRFGTKIERVVEKGDFVVRVKLSSGEEEAYDVLVLADGQWSTLRKQVFGTDGLEAVDKNCCFVYFTVPRTDEDDDYAHANTWRRPRA